MTRHDYPTFRLLGSPILTGGYLVQRKADEALIAVIIKHPDDPPRARWEVRKYNAPGEGAEGRHRSLRDAAEAAYDEWSGDVSIQPRIMLVHEPGFWTVQAWLHGSDMPASVNGIGSVRKLGVHPPFERADLAARNLYGVQVTDWAPQLAATDDRPTWKAVY